MSITVHSSVQWQCSGSPCQFYRRCFLDLIQVSCSLGSRWRLVFSEELLRSLIDGLGLSLGFRNLKSWVQERLFCLLVHPQLHVLGHLPCGVVRPPDGGDDQLIQCSPDSGENSDSTTLLSGNDDCSDEQGSDQPDQPDHEDDQDEQHGKRAE